MPQFYRQGDEPLDDLLRELGQQVRVERVRRSLSQRRLAELSGIAQGNISAIENGRIDVQIGTFFRLAGGMDMTFYDLVTARAQSMGTVGDAAVLP